jgi:hypothetical protein
MAVIRKKIPTSKKGIITAFEFKVAPNIQNNKLQIIVKSPKLPNIIASKISPLIQLIVCCIKSIMMIEYVIIRKLKG